ncbi:MAG: hypothetical protein O3A14_08235 [Cyanobacteria bacterium]|nr:hypothetical protein [Cyanobacteriota bacterium]
MQDSLDSIEKRLELCKGLSSLPTAQLDWLIFGLHPPDGSVPHSYAPPVERVVALLKWVEGPSGCGIEALIDLLRKNGLTTCIPAGKKNNGKAPLVSREEKASKLLKMFLNLGYKQQVSLFNKAIHASPITAFLIHGASGNYGQDWLMYLLLKKQIRGEPTKIPIDFSRKGSEVTPRAIWGEIGSRLKAKGGRFASELEISERLKNLLRTQHIILILTSISVLSESTLCEILSDFWMPLIKQLKVNSLDTTSKKLVLFLIDYKGDVDSWDIYFPEEVIQENIPQNPVKSQKLEEFKEDEISKWFLDLEEPEVFFPEIVEDTEKITLEVLENSENGIPLYVFEHICTRFNLNWHEDIEKCITP